MIPHFLPVPLRKFAQIGRQAFVAGPKRQYLEEVAWDRAVGAIWEFQSLFSPDNRKRLPQALVREEVVESDIEDHGNARQCRQRRYELAVLQLRQHRRG